MKINLLLADNSPRSGFINLDPLAPPDDPLRKQGDFGNLDEYVDDAECDELIATDVIDFIAPTQVLYVINHWKSKIRHGGTLVIGGLDLRRVAIELINHRLSMTEANLIIHGTQESPWQSRRSSYGLQTMLNHFQDFKVLQKRFDYCHYSLKVQRP